MSKRRLLCSVVREGFMLTLRLRKSYIVMEAFFSWQPKTGWCYMGAIKTNIITRKKRDMYIDDLLADAWADGIPKVYEVLEVQE